MRDCDQFSYKFATRIWLSDHNILLIKYVALNSNISLILIFLPFLSRGNILSKYIYNSYRTFDIRPSFTTSTHHLLFTYFYNLQISCLSTVHFSQLTIPRLLDEVLLYFFFFFCARKETFFPAALYFTQVVFNLNTLCLGGGLHIFPKLLLTLLLLLSTAV